MKNSAITITITGFKNKKEAIAWLQEYEGGLEQHFEFDGPSMTNTKSFIPEMKEFKENPDKTDFNLHLI